MLFVAGLDQGLALVQNYPSAEAILVDHELRVYVTGGLEHRFQADEGLMVKVLG